MAFLREVTLFLAMLQAMALAVPTDRNTVASDEAHEMQLGFTLWSAVKLLDANTFDAAVKANPFLLVDFYAPWCPICQALSDDYEAAALILKSDNPPIILAAVDCTAEVNQKLCRVHSVDGYPTLKIFKTTALGTSEYPYYLGPRPDQRTAVAIVNGLRLEAALH